MDEGSYCNGKEACPSFSLCFPAASLYYSLMLTRRYY
jgi:hypothetical protein